MHRISLSLFACVASCTLAISSAPAAFRAANISAAALVATSAASSPKAPASRSNSSSQQTQARALTRAARKARKAPKVRPATLAPDRVVLHKASNTNFAASQNAQAESNARAERLYRASQLSAPIIIDAKACKRVGRHGESIYENC
jgi:hypothetical protein